MRIIIRLNAETGVGLVYNFRTKQKVDGDGFPAESVRVQRLVADIMAKLAAGAGDRSRTDDQMVNAPFVITIFVRGYRGKRVFADMTFTQKPCCSSSLAREGLRVYGHLTEFFENTNGD